VAVDSTSGTVWVVNSLDGTVSEISEASRAVVATIRVGVSPVDVAVDPKTASVWVTCLGPCGDLG
jgi:YVTN family beta-propeller protein